MSYQHKIAKYSAKLQLMQNNMSGGVITDAERVRIDDEIGTLIFNVEGATEAMRADFNYMLAAVTHRTNYRLSQYQNGGLSLKYASDILKDDSVIVLAAVTQNGYALEYASVRLKGDSVIVLAAVSQNGMALGYASDTLKKDPKIVLAAVETDGHAMRFAHDSMKADPAIILTAVNHTGQALRYVPDVLKDHQIVLASVTQAGYALRYAPVEFRRNPEIVWAALMSNYPAALLYVHDDLKQDGEFIQDAEYASGWNSDFSDNEFQGQDMPLLVDAVLRNGLALQYMPDDIKNDTLIVMTAVEQNGLALQYASYDIRSTQWIVQIAMQQNPKAARYADSEVLAKIHRDSLVTATNFTKCTVPSTACIAAYLGTAHNTAPLQ